MCVFLSLFLSAPYLTKRAPTHPPTHTHTHTRQVLRLVLQDLTVLTEDAMEVFLRGAVLRRGSWLVSREEVGGAVLAKHGVNAERVVRLGHVTVSAPHLLL